MKRFSQLLAAVLMLVLADPAALKAQTLTAESVVPGDKAVRTGRLSNGLTYYIRHNNWPENRADFYIAQRVGSINEEENQRGLAHFLEHMCFNGTAHFPGNSLIQYLETLGVKFGENLNAYTSVDETVYNIDNVPTNRVSALDSCLLILRDWSHDLTLDHKEIDKERGVIEGEWRMRTGAQYRMLERCAPALFPGCRYGERLPIGLMSVVRNFKYKELKDYYQRWYRPDNQAIIVVGNVDVDRTEQKIRELFGSIKMPRNAARRVYYPVPDNDSIICAVEKDKEQAQTSVQLMFKHAAVPAAEKEKAGYMLRRFMVDAASSMLNDRLDELQKQPGVPFTMATTGDDDYVLAKTERAFTLTAGCETDKADSSLRVLTREAMRAREHGFTPSEFERYKANYLSSLESEYKGSSKEDNGEFVDACVRNFLDNEPMPSTGQRYLLMKALLPAVTVEQVNETYRSMVGNTDKNVVILVFCPDKAGQTVPQKASLIDAFRQARAGRTTAYVDKENNSPLIEHEPTAGRIVSETRLPMWNVKVWTLSNGIKVYLKKTGFEPDQVSITGEALGGTSMFGTTDVPDVKLLNQVMNVTGVGNFTVDELKKKLAGKNVSATTYIGDNKTSVYAGSTPADLRTAFQLMYLNITAPQPDTVAFRSLINIMETSLANAGVNPMRALADSVYQTIYSRHPLARMVDADMVKAVNYDNVLRMYRRVFSNLKGFSFTIIGNYDEDSVRTLTEQYIASLPAAGSPLKPVDTGFDFVKGSVRNEFSRKMETPQAVDYVAWENKCPYTLSNSIMADMIGQALQMRYLKLIREDNGWAYSVSMSGGVSAPDMGPGHPGSALFSANCPVKPEKSLDALDIIEAGMQAVARSGVDPEALAKIKEYMIKSARDNEKSNEYWRGIIGKYALYGVDFDSEYVKTVQNMTSDKLRDFARKYLQTANKAVIIMHP